MFYGWLGWDEQWFRFREVELEMVCFHPCRYVKETVWDPCWDCKVIRWEWQIELSIISIAVIWETMWVDHLALRGGATALSVSSSCANLTFPAVSDVFNLNVCPILVISRILKWHLQKVCFMIPHHHHNLVIRSGHRYLITLFYGFQPLWGLKGYIIFNFIPFDSVWSDHVQSVPVRLH